MSLVLESIAANARIMRGSRGYAVRPLRCCLTAALAVSALSSPSVIAQADFSPADFPKLELDLQKGCKRVEKQNAPTYNANRYVRASAITFCESKGGSSYVWYLLAANADRRFQGVNRSPWVNVKLFDRDNRTLFETKNEWLGEVGECAGYQLYVHKVPIGDNGPAVFGIHLSMPGAGTGGECTREDPWRLVKRQLAKAIRAVENCQTAGLTEDEKYICEAAKQHGSSFGGGNGTARE